MIESGDCMLYVQNVIYQEFLVFGNKVPLMFSTNVFLIQSIRLEEKNRYARLLQQFTNVPLSGTAFGNAHIPQHNKGSFSIT